MASIRRYNSRIMLKRLAILAMALICILPVDGQEKSAKPATNRESAEAIQKARSDSAPAVQINTVNPQASATKSDGSENHPKSYLGRLFSAENLPNIFLVAVGIFGVRAALKTLDEIKRQADLLERQTGILDQSVDVALESAEASKDSAKAANAQIQMMKDRERARISVSISDNEIGVGFEDFDALVIKIGNDGSTNAFNVTATGYASVEPTEDFPMYIPPMTLRLPDVLRANAESTPAEVAFINRYLLSDFDRDVAYFFHLYGTVDYQDVFGETHRTTFRYRMKILTVRVEDAEKNRVVVRSLWGWGKCGEPEDNYAS